ITRFLDELLPSITLSLYVVLVVSIGGCDEGIWLRSGARQTFHACSGRRHRSAWSERLWQDYVDPHFAGIDSRRSRFGASAGNGFSPPPARYTPTGWICARRRVSIS